MLEPLLLFMITGVEWIVVAVIIIVLLLWGPGQIPKLARAFRQAKEEWKKTAEESETEEEE